MKNNQIFYARHSSVLIELKKEFIILHFSHTILIYRDVFSYKIHIMNILYTHVYTYYPVIYHMLKIHINFKQLI